ncbi:hypothetical protein CKO15_05495 [Halorhodospira abdelmalekii]|uniref:hypothetical protein n=1 Tax=Halorhodospira abdelmalekii TaxID=421629 RepID=UPI001907493B|nr:hypothetical protein [Halorhodospira abdelmalekii]MBK1734750.1 hypothetical protein [Halorhodospira abdelmalekii]
MKRVRNFIEAARIDWAEDAAGRGAVKALIGAVLIVAGVLSALGELSGVAVGALIGALLLYLGSQLEPPEYADECSVEGEIAEVTELQRLRTAPRFRPIYSYKVKGKSYRLPATIRTLRPPQIGTPVRIACSASEPALAHREDGIEGHLHWVAYAAGAATVVVSLIGLLVSLVLVVAGLFAVRAGQADRSEAKQTQGLFKDLKILIYSISERAATARQRRLQRTEPTKRSTTQRRRKPKHSAE